MSRADANFSRNAIDLAWLVIFMKSNSEEARNHLARTFSDTGDVIERRRFGRIHQLVLGLSDGDLDGHLQASAATIDEVDIDGRTALGWAVCRLDTHAIRTLLQYTASVDPPKGGVLAE